MKATSIIWRHAGIAYRVVVNSVARHQQITNGSFSLLDGESGLVVVDAQVSQVDQPLSDADAVEGAQQ